MKLKSMPKEIVWSLKNIVVMGKNDSNKLFWSRLCQESRSWRQRCRYREACNLRGRKLVTEEPKEVPVAQKRREFHGREHHTGLKNHRCLYAPEKISRPRTKRCNCDLANMQVTALCNTECSESFMASHKEWDSGESKCRPLLQEPCLKKEWA